MKDKALLLNLTVDDYRTIISIQCLVSMVGRIMGPQRCLCPNPLNLSIC